jgi:hypothetical protein
VLHFHISDETQHPGAAEVGSKCSAFPVLDLAFSPLPGSWRVNRCS